MTIVMSKAFVTGLSVGVLGAAVAIPYAARYAYRRATTVVSEAGEASASELVELMDTVTEDPSYYLEQDEGESELKPLRRGMLMRCAVAAALVVRSKMGVVLRTASNKKVVELAVLAVLRARNMRSADIVRVAPLATVAVFVKTSSDLLEKELLAAEAVVERVAAAERDRKSGTMAAWILRWFGAVEDRLEFPNK